MTIADPFAAPADEPQTAPKGVNDSISEALNSAPKLVSVPTPSEGKVVLTFKGGRDFDAPWIVIHAADLEDAHASVYGDNAVLLSSLMEQVQKAGQHFAGVKPVSQNAAAAPAPQRQAPQGATEPPSWFPPPPAPDWVYKTGFKNGNSWHAWAPAQKGGGDWQFHRPPK